MQVFYDCTQNLWVTISIFKYLDLHAYIYTSDEYLYFGWMVTFGLWSHSRIIKFRFHINCTKKQGISDFLNVKVTIFGLFQTCLITVLELDKWTRCCWSIHPKWSRNHFRLAFMPEIEKVIYWVHGYSSFQYIYVEVINIFQRAETVVRFV